MAKGTRVTIEDVARVACVTPQTVSRALRGAPDISEATKHRILKIASELNYVKNTSASSLRHGSTKLIAIIYDNLLNLYFSIMIDFLQYCLRDKGYTVLTISQRNMRLTEEAYYSAVSRNVDGIISFLEPEKGLSSIIRKYNVPVLLFGRRTDEDAIDYIVSDDVAGGALVAQRFVDRGCKNVLFVSETLDLTCAYDRFSGFSEVLQRNGIEVRYTQDPSMPKLEEYLLSAAKGEDGFPDGIFCFNDMIAFELLYLIEKNKLPSTYVVGYDGLQNEIYIPRKLTSVAVDKRQMAESAADIILAKVKGDRADRFTKTVAVSLSEGVTA